MPSLAYATTKLREACNEWDAYDAAQETKKRGWRYTAQNERREKIKDQLFDLVDLLMEVVGNPTIHLK